MRRLIIVILCGLLLAGGAIWLLRPSHHATVNAALYENDMVEGLVRQLLIGLKSPPPPICFLAFGDGTTPPGPRFIARFIGCNPEVRSCGSAAMPPINQYFDRRTGKPGLIIHIIDFKKVVTATFDVKVGFSNLPPGHDQFIYRVADLGDGWKIMRCTGV